MYLGYSNRVYVVLLRLIVSCCEDVSMLLAWNIENTSEGKEKSDPNGLLYILISEGRDDGKNQSERPCLWLWLWTTLLGLCSKSHSYWWQYSLRVATQWQMSLSSIDRTSRTFHDLPWPSMTFHGYVVMLTSTSCFVVEIAWLVVYTNASQFMTILSNNNSL